MEDSKPSGDAASSACSPSDCCGAKSASSSCPLSAKSSPPPPSSSCCRKSSSSPLSCNSADCPSKRKCILATVLSPVLATPPLLFPSLKPLQLAPPHCEASDPSLTSARHELFRYAPPTASPYASCPFAAWRSPWGAPGAFASSLLRGCPGASGASSPSRDAPPAERSGGCPIRATAQRVASGWRSWMPLRRDAPPPAEPHGAEPDGAEPGAKQDVGERAGVCPFRGSERPSGFIPWRRGAPPAERLMQPGEAAEAPHGERRGLCPVRGAVGGASRGLFGGAQRGSGSPEAKPLDERAAHGELNPLNMMPEISNEPGEEEGEDNHALSTKRRISTIPKTGEDSTWVYPSPLQFHRAVQRKNKEPPPPEAMESTVFVHDLVNERTWKKILQWERALHSECEKLTLSRFVGRSEDYTPTARFRQLFSYLGLPFDRHDWYVNRCGETVRYVVDYYDDTRAEDNIQVFIHARPAWFDSWQNFADNVRRMFASS
ncbi:putative cytochrome C-type heme lyase [Besnoitia besnoiti]|uniref:Holocytochrome c-type synthase n=1 Tax=Besnoitia besnoiti TaxID=94643 RepID=A0A2A9ML69_BESBE|nr:putative cytochrome C-type heme lyase [Besnoitia besnoiti]PFH38765.1 putative cytochrome C-type heme lyase [Besnoitia besnoiti]